MYHLSEQLAGCIVLLKALEDVKVCMYVQITCKPWHTLCMDKLISALCCFLTFWVYSHLSIGVFQRCLLLPPPKNEIWPFLQHTSCKLPLMYMCVQPVTRCALNIYSAVKRYFIYLSCLSYLNIVWWSESFKGDKYFFFKITKGQILFSQHYIWKLQAAVFVASFVCYNLKCCLSFTGISSPIPMFNDIRFSHKDSVQVKCLCNVFRSSANSYVI